jgi:RNA polymerase sigma-70 factor (ECF subfamily)
MTTGHDLPRVTPRPHLVTVSRSDAGSTTEANRPGDELRDETLGKTQPTSEGEFVELLVMRARGGDTSAWARLYQDHFDRLYRSIFAMLHERSLTEDVVQETFARALVSLDRFDGRARFSTWLHAIAHNVVRKHWRKDGRGERSRDRLTVQLDVAAQGAPDLEDEHLSKKRAEVLSAVVAELPEHLREAFVSVDVLALPHPEAAARLGISEGNLRVRATRARARIRERLTELGWLQRPEGESK